MIVFVTGTIKTPGTKAFLSPLRFLTVVPLEGQYKVILVQNLAIALVPTEKRAGTESIVLMTDSECNDQYKNDCPYFF